LLKPKQLLSKPLAALILFSSDYAVSLEFNELDKYVCLMSFMCFSYILWSLLPSFQQSPLLLDQVLLRFWMCNEILS